MKRKYRRNPIISPARSTGSLQGLLTLGIIALVGLFGLDWLRTRGKAALTAAQSAVTETLVKLAPSPAEQKVNAMLSAPATSVTRPVLRMGASVAPENLGYVVEAQNRLGLPTSGIFDAAMRNAVIAFQMSKGLTPDGIIGPATWGALLGRLPVASH